MLKIRRILKDLFSERNKEGENKKARDIFNNDLFGVIVKLITSHAITYEPPYFEKALGDKHPFDSWKDFWDRLSYNIKEFRKEALPNYFGGSLMGYFPDLSLSSFFDMLEIYGMSLTELCKKFNDFTIFHLFKDEFNTLMEKEEIPYRIIINNEGKYQIQHLTNNFTQKRIEEVVDLIQDKKFNRVNTHFFNALRCQTRRDTDGLLRECNNSLEAMLQTVLNKSEGKIIPLYKEFKDNVGVPRVFENNCKLLLGLIKKVQNTRSQETDVHSSDKDIEPNIEELSELIFNLTMSFIIYIKKISDKTKG